MKLSTKVFAICQPDALGDVIACLPMACAIKREIPGAKVLLIGRTYSQPLIASSVWIDGYLDADAVLARPKILAEHGVEVFLNPYLPQAFGAAARQAGVPIRIGNLLRPKNFVWANRFSAQSTGRVQRHRALLNLKYLEPLGLRSDYTVEELGTMLGLERTVELAPDLQALLDPGRFNLILHPKSNRSGREWPSACFERLVDRLPADRVKVFVTGRPNERDALSAESGLLARDNIIDLTGRLGLDALIAFYRAADGMVGSGTGPLHIAAGVGIHALGLFPGRARITAARWHPLGPKGESLSFSTRCRPSAATCPDNYAGEPCPCMLGIEPDVVAARVMRWVMPSQPAALPDASRAMNATMASAARCEEGVSVKSNV